MLQNQNLSTPRLPKPVWRFNISEPVFLDLEFVIDETTIGQSVKMNSNIENFYKGVFAFANLTSQFAQNALILNWLNLRYFFTFFLNLFKYKKKFTKKSVNPIVESTHARTIRLIIVPKFNFSYSTSQIILYFLRAFRNDLIFDKDFLFFHFFFRNNFKFFQNSLWNNLLLEKNKFYIFKLSINRLCLQESYKRNFLFLPTNSCLIKKFYQNTSKIKEFNLFKKLGLKVKLHYFFLRKLYNGRHSWVYLLLANLLSWRFNHFFLKRRASFFFTEIADYLNEIPISFFASAPHASNCEFLASNCKLFSRFYSISKISTYFSSLNSFESRFPFLHFKSLIYNSKNSVYSRLLSSLLDSNYWAEFSSDSSVESSILPTLSLKLRNDFAPKIQRRLTFSRLHGSLPDLSVFSRFEASFFFFFKPLFFKTLTLINWSNDFSTQLKLFLSRTHSFFQEKAFFYTTPFSLSFSSAVPGEHFNYVIKKKIIKVLDYSRFAPVSVFIYYNTLIRFLEYSSGKKVYFRLHPFLINNLNISEKLQCLMWAQKVKYFRKVLGPRLFLNESLQIIYLSLKYHDPFMLSNWMVGMLQKISFWKLKTFLRYIKYVLRCFFWGVFDELFVRGVKFQLKGKVSVSGNARTRTVFHSVGLAGHSTFNNKILFHLNLVRTFTGVLGLKLWIIF